MNTDFQIIQFRIYEALFKEILNNIFHLIF